MTILNLMIFKMRNAWFLTGLSKVMGLSILFSILLSCSDVQKRQKPDKLLTESQMVEIYTDMVLLDAVSRSVSKKFKSYNLEPSEHIYNKYKIDSTTLADNMAYYNLEFETNAEIYKKVSENIEKRKTYIDSVVQLKDSLKKIEQQKKLKLKDSLKTDTLKTRKNKKPKSIDADTSTNDFRQLDKN